MSRTFHGLLHAMEKLTKGIPEALCLVRGLKKRAVALKWDPKVEFDPENSVRIGVETRFRKPVFVIFLPEGSRPPSDEGLVWLTDVRFGGGNDIAPALFVNTVACHEDWLALKAVHELGLIEIEETVNELESRISSRIDLPAHARAALLVDTAKHLRLHQEILISRLVDRRLRGHVKSRVKKLRQRLPKYYDIAATADKLTNEIHNELLPLAWPDSASREEKHVRNELLGCVARGFINRDIQDAIVLS